MCVWSCNLITITCDNIYTRPSEINFNAPFQCCDIYFFCHFKNNIAISIKFIYLHTKIFDAEYFSVRLMVKGHNFKDKRHRIKMTLQSTSPMSGGYALNI